MSDLFKRATFPQFFFHGINNLPSHALIIAKYDRARCRKTGLICKPIFSVCKILSISTAARFLSKGFNESLNS